MDLRISLLNFYFAMIYIIHKILVLIKNHLNYLNNIFEFFFNRLFFKYITMESLSLEEENIFLD